MLILFYIITLLYCKQKNYLMLQKIIHLEFRSIVNLVVYYVDTFKITLN